MLSLAKLTLLGALAAVGATTVIAYQESPGSPCSGSGPCTWISSGQTVNGYCAPNGYCGDAGATCSSDSSCYDYCGGGICGGPGAACDSQTPSGHNKFETSCYTPSYTCTTSGSPGTCVLSASPGSRLREKRRAAGGHIEARQTEASLTRRRIYEQAAHLVAREGDEQLE